MTKILATLLLLKAFRQPLNFSISTIPFNYKDIKIVFNRSPTSKFPQARYPLLFLFFDFFYAFKNLYMHTFIIMCHDIKSRFHNGQIAITWNEIEEVEWNSYSYSLVWWHDHLRFDSNCIKIIKKYPIYIITIIRFFVLKKKKKKRLERSLWWPPWQKYGGGRTTPYPPQGSLGEVPQYHKGGGHDHSQWASS
jgi:hypothetical protein